MLSDLFIGDKNVRRITIITLVLVCIWSVYCIHRLETNVADLQTKLTEQEKKTKELETKFESFKSLTSSEFESTWKSFSMVRNNFVAIGKGYHLEQEDICPEEECQEEYAGKKLKEEL